MKDKKVSIRSVNGVGESGKFMIQRNGTVEALTKPEIDKMFREWAGQSHIQDYMSFVDKNNLESDKFLNADGSINMNSGSLSNIRNLVGDTLSYRKEEIKQSAEYTKAYEASLEIAKENAKARAQARIAGARTTAKGAGSGDGTKTGDLNPILDHNAVAYNSVVEDRNTRANYMNTLAALSHGGNSHAFFSQLQKIAESNGYKIHTGKDLTRYLNSTTHDNISQAASAASLIYKTQKGAKAQDISNIYAKMAANAHAAAMPLNFSVRSAAQTMGLQKDDVDAINKAIQARYDINNLKGRTVRIYDTIDPAKAKSNTFTNVTKAKLEELLVESKDKNSLTGKPTYDNIDIKSLRIAPRSVNFNRDDPESYRVVADMDVPIYGTSSKTKYRHIVGYKKSVVEFDPKDLGLTASDIYGK